MSKPHFNSGNRYAAVENPKKPIQIMITSDERDLFDDAAKKAGMSRSAWIVAQCLSSLKKESK